MHRVQRASVGSVIKGPRQSWNHPRQAGSQTGSQEASPGGLPGGLPATPRAGLPGRLPALTPGAGNFRAGPGRAGPGRAPGRRPKSAQNRPIFGPKIGPKIDPFLGLYTYISIFEPPSQGGFPEGGFSASPGGSREPPPGGRKSAHFFGYLITLPVGTVWATFSGPGQARSRPGSRPGSREILGG